MLQIIGWLGCIYLVVKALEIAGSNSNYNDEGKMRGQSLAAAIIAWLGAAVFGCLFLLQGIAVSTPTPLVP